MGADGGLANSLEAHRKYLLRYALFQLRDASLAEDAVQDTLVAALARGEGTAHREAADLIYHLLVALKGAGASWEDVERELLHRRR